MTSYNAVGFLLGLAGLLIGGSSGTGIPILLQGILKLIAGAVMVVMGLNMLGIFPWLRGLNPHLPWFLSRKLSVKQATNRWPFIVGLLNGLMPCGPLQSMQILALASGTATSFQSAVPCTRASLVKYIWQATGMKSAPASSFPDVPSGAPYAPAVDWAAANGITVGTGDGRFNPDGTCTRVEIVIFLYRAYAA